MACAQEEWSALSFRTGNQSFLGVERWGRFIPNIVGQTSASHQRGYNHERP